MVKKAISRRSTTATRPYFETLEPRTMLAGDGLLGQYFNEIDLMSPVAQTYVDSVINFPNDVLGASARGRVDNDDSYSIRWTGWVLVDQPGEWQLKTLSNDGVRLWLNDVQLINHWNQHVVATDVGNMTLESGWHPIRLEYFQQNGASHIELRYSGPGQTEIIIPQSHLSSTDPIIRTQPTANAGPDITLILPNDNNEAVLNGSGVDSDGTIVSYAWSQLSGPNTAVLSGESMPTLSASNLVLGTYVFQLNVTDNDGNSDTDSATIHVAQSTGDGTISGELKKWHKVTITFDGPETSESATPNPFLDYRLNVTFTHAATNKTYVVPGYYAADGNAADSHANSGNKWRVHFAPSEQGEWTYVASFRFGANVAVDDNPLAGVSGAYFDNAAAAFTIAPTDKDKSGRDHRGKGQLQYVGEHYLRFAETGEYFLKQGADSPENLLAYTEFDGPFKTDGQGDQYIKDWSAHVEDWQAGDPTWGSDQGKGIIGAVNYLASEGQNVFSFLTMNIQGDDRNVFPYLTYNERLRIDVSRLDQWEILFEHADRQGMYLHFKTQETENDQLLDGGALGTQRKLYYRELIARFSHHLALNWNLGEENTNTTAQQIEFADYFHDLDPYDHNIVLHTFPGAHSSVYAPLVGAASELTGQSIQIGNFADAHEVIRTWVANSAAAGKKWVVAIDESGGANQGVRPDNDAGSSHENARKNTLWGTLMAGGAGDEWYFGYGFPHSDLTLTDFRSRDQWWDYTRYALEFFKNNEIPFWQMTNDNAISSATDDYALIKSGEVYVVYLKNGGTTILNLADQTGIFEVSWYDPRHGGSLQKGSVEYVMGGGSVGLGPAPNTPLGDWIILVRRPDLPGDYDDSGTVNDNDYATWHGDFGSLSKLDADGNRDGQVDAADYVVWRANLGRALSASATDAAATSITTSAIDAAFEEQLTQGSIHPFAEVAGPRLFPDPVTSFTPKARDLRTTISPARQQSLWWPTTTPTVRSAVADLKENAESASAAPQSHQLGSSLPSWRVLDVAVSVWPSF
jgi:hypothetical protein